MTLAPWRALCGALDQAEDRTQDAITTRVRTLPVAHRGGLRVPLTTHQAATCAELPRALVHVTRGFLAAVAASPLASAMPPGWAASVVLADATPLSTVAAVLRRTYAPLVRAAVATPELVRERFAERVVLLVQALLVAIERVQAIADTSAPLVQPSAGALVARVASASRTARTSGRQASR